MAIDPALLSILACPQDKGPLFYVEDEDFLYNPRLRRKYPVRDDIAVMLIDESSQADDAEHARVTALIESRGIKATFGA
ncbi:MAG: hypothetical protein RJA47_1272 [Actinomycetota bacterium]|jgi:uncharacterized protein YbaR (Trm112 family)